MELLLQVFFELFFEGGATLSVHDRVPKPLRIILVSVILLCFGGVLVLLMTLALSPTLNTGERILVAAVFLVLIGYIIYFLRQVKKAADRRKAHLYEREFYEESKK